MTDLARTRDTLVRRLAELEGRAARVNAELVAPESADLEDQAAETEDDDVERAEQGLLDTELAAVGAAIMRIDAGRYGLCSRCGEPIAAARLAAMPEAALCLACAAAAPA